MTTLLDVEALRAGYGPVEVLHGIDLSVGEGEIVVVLGANGAGKTTTMRAISGVTPPRGTFVDLSVEDNLRIGGYTRRDGEVDKDVDRWFDVFPRLRERRTQRAGGLSGGEQQMLAISRALMSRPRLLLCDEPSLGLAPIIVQELFGILGRLNTEEGVSILLVEQNANLAMDIAHRAYLLETGSIVASGDADTIRGDDAVRKAYLGY
jgi:branched-chain amino acid transport system ATP-binding protein